LRNKWVEPDVRDEIVDFVTKWTNRFDCLSIKLIVSRLGLSPSRFSEWRRRYAQPNYHNSDVPRSHWITEEEKERVIDFYLEHYEDGYRRCAYMMIDADVAYCSPSTVYRILSKAGVIGTRWNSKGSSKGKGFNQPLRPHEHWHIDISYINVSSTFYYLISILDGYSRYIVHYDLRESMTEKDVQLIVQKAKELYPEANPRIISDNGKQFIAKDFKELIRFHGMTHVTTSPYYPQSNGKIERWHKTIKSESIRPGAPISFEDAKRLIAKYVLYYNNTRLHSAIGYVTPKDKLEGRENLIHQMRDKKLENARRKRLEFNRNRQVIQKS